MILDDLADRGFVARLSPEDRARLAAALRPQRFEDGAEVIAQGETTRDAYLMLRGRAVATTFSRDGRAISYRDIGPGDLFGEVAALDGLPRSAFVLAVGRVEAGVLPWRVVDAMIAESPDFARALLVYLAGIVRATTDRLFENVTLLMRERLIRELLRRAAAAGVEDDAAALRPPPTHLELAQRIGSHREGVTKELAALARRGLVERREGALRLPSLQALQEELDGGANAGE